MEISYLTMAIYMHFSMLLGIEAHIGNESKPPYKPEALGIKKKKTVL